MSHKCFKSLIVKHNYVRNYNYFSWSRTDKKPTAAAPPTGSSALPSQTKVVIFGNDLTTLSIAYHLSEELNYGKNCVVIYGQTAEDKKTRDQFNSSPFSHLNVFNPRATQLIDYSRNVFNITKMGALYLANEDETLDSFKRRISSAKLVFNNKSSNDSNELLSAQDIGRRYPLLDINCIKGGIFVANDGVIEDITAEKKRLEEVSKKNGIQFFDNLLLHKINVNNNKVSNVELLDCQSNTIKRIECQYFINASNNYLTRNIAKRSVTRVRVPTLCVHNQVLSTKPFDDILPIIHDFDKKFTVYQTSDKRLFLTGYEKVSKILFKNLPETNKTGAMNEQIPEIKENWDDFHRILNPILTLMPSLKSAQLQHLVTRLENFTPDGRALVGEVPEIENYLLCAAVVPQLVAGAGRIITDIIAKKDHYFGHDFWSLDPRRFLSTQSNRIFLFDRLREVPAKSRYIMNYPQPHNDYETGHGLRLGPLYPRLKEAGALFVQIMGYDRPAVYMPTLDMDDSDSESLNFETNSKHNCLLTHSFGRPFWLDAVKEEYTACRERVALLDYGSFSKLDIKSLGSEALELLQFLCSNDVDVNVGQIVHTGMQNERGGYENDASVIRLAYNHFMIVGPTEQQTRCFSWLQKHNIDKSVQITDLSPNYSAICVMGPLSRQLLSEVLADPSALESFPFFTYKNLAIGLAKNVRVCNLTHTGELGWVLYIPNKHTIHVYDQLLRAGTKYEMRHAGSIAMRTLRIEKFFAFWGQDLDTTTTPLECGRAFRVKFDKEFLGRDELVRQRDEGVKRRYVQLLLEDFDDSEPIWAWGGEPIFICDPAFDNTVPVGLTTTTGYGFTLQRHVCLGFITHPNNEVVTNDFILKSRFEVEIGGKRFKARTNIHSPKLTDVSESYLPTR